MHQDGDCPLAVDVALAVLFGANHALDDRVDQFEVAGVAGERKMDFAAGLGGEIVGVAEMVFDVAIAGDFGGGTAFDFAEKHFVGLAEDMGEDVESSAVGHADGHFIHAEFSAFFDEGVHERGEGVAALVAEAFDGGKAAVEEGF